MVYATIGYRVGTVPIALDDLFAVVVNNLHFEVEENLKIIIDGDEIWVTATLASTMGMMQTTGYNIDEAHLN